MMTKAGILFCVSVCLSIIVVYIVASWAAAKTIKQGKAGDEASAPLLTVAARSPSLYTYGPPEHVNNFTIYEKGEAGLRIERKVLSGVPMLELARPDGSSLACVDLDTGDFVVGPCVARLKVVPVRKVKP